MKIAILGAECTGKSQLAQSLCDALRSSNITPILVTEALRQWCEVQGRTPLAHEQSGIAKAQAAEIQASGATTVLVSDTSALMTAIYSDLFFNDPALYPYGLAQQKHFDITLVTGLDLPWVPDGFQRDGVAIQRAVDTRLRQVLSDNAVPYVTVYGTGNRRTESALQAISHHTIKALQPRNTAASWHWNCENCSDATCERRLFSGLVATSTSMQI
jgi:HTH-type transcriptional repressor of NAD biosynthesis genes